MKKRFILLPLLLFVLAGCDPVVDPTASTSPSPSETDPTTTVDPTDTSSDPTSSDPVDERTEWEKSLPDGYSSIAEILAEGEEGDYFETRGQVTFLNGGQIVIQDGDNNAIMLYEGTMAQTLSVGDVIDTYGKFAFNADMPQLAYDTSTYIEVVDEECEITPLVIEGVADYTSKLADFKYLEGEGRKQVLVKEVITSAYGSPKANMFTISTADGQSFNVLVGFSMMHNAAEENRVEIGPLVDLINANEGATFDLLGVYYNANGKADGWQIGISTIEALLNVPDDLEEPEPDPADPDGTALINFATTAHRVSQDENSQVWKSHDEIVTLTVSKGESTTNVADYYNPIRIYKYHHVEFSALHKIEEIVITANSAKYASDMLGDALAVTGGTVALGDDGVTITITAAADVTSVSFANDNAQTRWNEVEIHYTLPA